MRLSEKTEEKVRRIHSYRSHQYIKHVRSLIARVLQKQKHETFFVVAREGVLLFSYILGK